METVRIRGFVRACNSGSVLTLGLAVALWRLMGPGKRLRFGAVTLYYTPVVTADEAKRVSAYLARQKYQTRARLDREGATYRLQLIGSPGQVTEKQVIECEVLAAGLSDDVLAGAGVEVGVCDNVFRPTSAVRHRGRFGRRITMNAAYLFYLEEVTDDEALLVATFLAGAGVFNDAPKVAQMDRSAGGYEFRLAVEVLPLTPEMLTGERQMATDLSRVLGGGPVVVRYCAGLLGTLRAVELRAGEDRALNSFVPGGPFSTQVFHTPDNLIADLRNRI